MTQTIGIIGGGQLGRMMALAGHNLGLRFCCLEPGADSPMGQVAPQITGDYDDSAKLIELAGRCSVITYEFENVPITAAMYLARIVPVYPPPLALEMSQDRWHEKSCFKQLGIPTPAFARVSGADDLEEGIAAVGGLPAVLKTRRFGYDGKGQWVLRAQADVAHAQNDLLKHEVTTGYIAESFVPFTRELSIIAVRGINGESAFYPLVENQHRDGILRVSRAPALGAPQALAEDYARRVLTHLNYVGVLAIEFFEQDSYLIANEMAPRVHNSGHWTQDGATTSQFENHVRAITGLPLGTTAVRGCAAMVNLIGTTPESSAILAIPDAHLHLYGKSPRPGRKLGHVNLVTPDITMLEQRIAAILALIG